MKQSLPDLVKAQLRQAVGIPIDANGYVSRVVDNLLPGVRLDHFESDLKRGGGHELNKKFLALHSSAALAINTFDPFKDFPRSLSLLEAKDQEFNVERGKFKVRRGSSANQVLLIRFL